MADALSPGPAAGRTDARRRARRKLLLIAAICIAPVVASYAVYYLAPRHASVNYGTLLPTAPAPALDGARADGTAFRLADLAGRWVLLIDVEGRCDATCANLLYATRQARTMQGKDRDRIVRVLLAADGEAIDPALLAEHPDLIVATVAPARRAALPGGGAAVYLVDPLGNLVLRYGPDPDIKGINRDLTRLLKASSIG